MRLHWDPKNCGTLQFKIGTNWKISNPSGNPSQIAHMGFPKHWYRTSHNSYDIGQLEMVVKEINNINININ